MKILLTLTALLLSTPAAFAQTGMPGAHFIENWDLDGNGIEITFETPWRGTIGAPDSGTYVTATDGSEHSGREPIDVDGLIDGLLSRPLKAERV